MDDARRRVLQRMEQITCFAVAGFSSIQRALCASIGEALGKTHRDGSMEGLVDQRETHQGWDGVIHSPHETR